jgi:hypothetical protein
VTPSQQLRAALAPLPATLVDELLATFTVIITNFREHRWEPSELNGGKFCEVAYTIVRGAADNSYPKRSTKPANMVDACHALEQASSTLPRSIRIQIPRMLIALYEIRNNRGVGHTGGDVDPNHMDAVTVVAMTKWIMAEFVRVYQGVDTQTATALVDTLVEREVSLIWEVMGRKRVLRPGMTLKDKTLVLLYGSPHPTAEADLIEWTECSNPSMYRRDVLRRAHKDRLIEYDADAKVVELSPLGSALVEERLLDVNGN